ncbi:unnamed protein product [Acanthoscelides obtectus]|uniref:Uncharacterized protein n=1 Tax=Acanthoscelides obtectus TaxID=200917 RepID=A0A9P0JMM5_ACAOB|nr:unnamed protein product [Acanthoscelides obtectus]CAK1634791.1 hypothetical protein AOBTE_LOCUS8901 [Acanthoscelides obtectus]
MRRDAFTQWQRCPIVLPLGGLDRKTIDLIERYWEKADLIRRFPDYPSNVLMPFRDANTRPFIN